MLRALILVAMTRVVACVLALDGLSAAERTIASAQRFGLDVVVGLADEVEGEGSTGGEIRHIDWRENLADARNQLAALVDADWLLWIDPDEELAAFDVARIDGLKGPVAAVRLRDRLGYATPTKAG